MGSSFVFEPPSDEEIEDLESEEEEQEEGEGDEEEEKVPNRQKQSPWDFALYSESAAEEHTRRSTTSIDFKISKSLQQRSVPIAKAVDEDKSDSEPDKQVIELSQLQFYNLLYFFSNLRIRLSSFFNLYLIERTFGVHLSKIVYKCFTEKHI